MNSLQEGKVVNFLQYKYNKLIGELREYPDCFEYIIIKNYENAFNFQRTECIQMDRCFVQVIKSGPSYEMISFIFLKMIGQCLKFYIFFLNIASKCFAR